MASLEILESVKFVVDQEGRLSAVQMSRETWEALLDYLDDVEDRAYIKDILPRLRKGPEQLKALNWDDVKEEWDSLDMNE